jgi:pyridoxal phosphate enzyme (YggS family)
VTIADSWREVQARVAAACARAGRSPSAVTVVAVSKLQPTAAVVEAAAAGVTDFGENYAQELLRKQGEVAAVRWHFIGKLQRNKAKLVVGRTCLIHAVDSLELAREIDRRAAALGQVQEVLLAVNLGGEDSKSGVAGDEVANLLEQARGLAHLRVKGLMTMPPPVSDPEASRPHFRALAGLRDRLAAIAPLPILSMGMSGDFEVAIAEGATHVRVGTAIFGARHG